MTRYNNLLKLLTLALATGIAGLTGCSRDDNETGEPPREPVRFVLSAGELKTRVAMDADTYKSTFEAGDEAGIYAVHYTAGTGSLTASDNILHNRKLTYDGMDWTLDGQPFYVPVDGKVDFFAYYPYDASADDPTAMTFDIGADQGAQADFSRADLMTVQARGITARDKTVSLPFGHNLAILELRFGDGKAPLGETVILDDYMLAPVTFSLEGLSGGGVPATGKPDPRDITMYRPADDVAWALVPAGTADGLIYTLGGKSYTIDREIELTAGRVSSYDVKLRTGPETNEVGARYYLNGVHVGYVWKVNTTDGDGNSNNDGLVIYHQYVTDAVLNDPWEGRYTTVCTLDSSDGWENFEKLKEDVSGWRALEPWAWCHDLGDGWYVPTWDELTACAYALGEGMLANCNPVRGAAMWNEAAFGYVSTRLNIFLEFPRFPDGIWQMSLSAYDSTWRLHAGVTTPWGFRGLALAFRKY